LTVVCGYSANFMSETSVYRIARLKFVAESGQKYRIKKQDGKKIIAVVDSATRKVLAQSETIWIGGCRVSGYYLLCPKLAPHQESALGR
jgi:hypothetical protein